MQLWLIRRFRSLGSGSDLNLFILTMFELEFTILFVNLCKFDKFIYVVDRGVFRVSDCSARALRFCNSRYLIFLYCFLFAFRNSFYVFFH